MKVPSYRCPGPVSRRGFLEIGSIGLAGLGFADLLRLQAQAKETNPLAEDTAVIFVWLPGGPPHMEMYDMKPDAPEEISRRVPADLHQRARARRVRADAAARQGRRQVHDHPLDRPQRSPTTAAATSGS